MPTGYTDKVQSGEITEFKDYALLCARAFGATIMMRDEPLDAEIPEFKPSTFDAERLEETKRDLDEFKQMDTESRRKMFEEKQQEKRDYRLKRLEEISEQAARYAKMLEKAVKYEPPTKDHVEFKDFMVKQLEDSIEFDCNVSYLKEVQVTFEQWEEDRLDSLEKDLVRYKESQEEEDARTEGRNRWVRDLKKSL